MSPRITIFFTEHAWMESVVELNYQISFVINCKTFYFFIVIFFCNNLSSFWHVLFFETHFLHEKTMKKSKKRFEKV
jgi:hypothetical protein